MGVAPSKNEGRRYGSNYVPPGPRKAHQSGLSRMPRPGGKGKEREGFFGFRPNGPAYPHGSQTTSYYPPVIPDLPAGDSPGIPGPSMPEPQGIPGSSMPEPSAMPGLSMPEPPVMPGSSRSHPSMVPGSSRSHPPMMPGSSTSQPPVIPGSFMPEPPVIPGLEPPVTPGPSMPQPDPGYVPSRPTYPIDSRRTSASEHRYSNGYRQGHGRSYSSPAASTHRRYSDRVPAPHEPPDFTAPHFPEPEPAPRGTTPIQPIFNPPPVIPNPQVPSFRDFLEPLPPPHPGVYGPPGPRPRRALRNPLPPPPRDLYELAPYKALLKKLPESDLLTRPPLHAIVMSEEPKTGLFGRKRRSGLFRTFSYGHNSASVPVTRADMPNSLGAALLDAARVAPEPLHQRRMSSQYQQPRRRATTSGIQMPVPATQATSAFAPPNPARPTDEEPVQFDHMGPGLLSGFMNHSPHRVLYQGKTYPSALHLHEAMKFINHRADLAERIRSVPQAHEVYPLSASFQKHVRSDWSGVFLAMMGEVIYLKFKQHPDVRRLLMETGTAEIIYTEANDPFWGAGPNGRGSNHLGRILMQVRDQLREEGY